MVIQEFEAAGGGFVPGIIGKKFAGKKAGTWRRVLTLVRITAVAAVEWENERGRMGSCGVEMFKSWCRKPAFVIED